MKVYVINKILVIGYILLLACTTQAAEEKKLITVLRSDASVFEKCDACKQLGLYGTAKSIPDIAVFLNDSKIAHAARYALEIMPFPEAGDALRGALSKTSGLNKAGIIDSLGWRREKASVPLLVPLLFDANTIIAATSASALGKIGGSDSISALVTARDHPNSEVRTAVLEALLLCAENHYHSGKKYDAALLYRDLFQLESTSNIRIAAWRGWMLSESKQRQNLIPKALKGGDANMQFVAVKLIRELKDQELLATCVQQWDSLPTLAQLAVLDAHLQFGSEALPTIRIASKSSHPAVRTAAWRSLADLNDMSLIPSVVRAAAHAESQEKAAACDALVRMCGPCVQAALMGHLQKVKSSEEKAVLLRSLGHRGDTAAVSILLENTKSTEDIVKLAALDALRSLAVPDTLMPLFRIAAASKSNSQRSAALKALYAAYYESAEIVQAGRQIIAAMKNYSPTEQYNVLPLFAKLATAEALAVVQKAVRSSNAQLSREALHVLTEWPDAAPAQFLLELARTSTDPVIKIVALRSGITVAERESDPSARLAILRKALTQADRNQEKIMILGQLGRISTTDSLNLALQHLQDPDLVNEASLAAVSVAKSLAAKHPNLADEAARKVLSCCKLKSVVIRAWNLRIEPPASGPFIRDWLVCGPYRQIDATGADELFDLEFGPEKTNETPNWCPVPVGDMVDLAELFPGQEDCVAYLKAEIFSPKASEAILLMGSNDGIKAWLNGTVVHRNNFRNRKHVVDQDAAAITLKQGNNELLLKITQSRSDWSACARIVGIDNSLIEGLRIQSQENAVGPVSRKKSESSSSPAVKEAALPPRDTFRTRRLSDKFYAEGAYYGDFNRDGKMDAVAGPFWFEGPDYQKRHEYREAKSFDPKHYSDNFLTFTGDFNGDEWIDILCVPRPKNKGFWYANPAGKDGHWQRYLAHSYVGDESPAWGDITGDGRTELIFSVDGCLGYAGPDPSKPDNPWTFHYISRKDKKHLKFNHGTGFGDINGDRRTDVVKSIGWWEQPADKNTDAPWAFHPFQFADAGAQMLVYDVDGNGLADIITSWHCHRYGLIWWKQLKKSDGKTDWQQHIILSPTPDISTDDFRVSQMHALALVDMNGDGIKDILTGKRFWAHGPNRDEEPGAPAVVFWLELQRRNQENIAFVPHLIDDDSGVGTQVAATDINNDSRPDVIVANKKGIFIHLSQAKNLSDEPD